MRSPHPASRFLVWLVVLSFALVATGGMALAQSDTKDKAIIYDTTEAGILTGEHGSPGAVIISEPDLEDSTSLIRLRNGFVDRMIESVEDL